MAHTDTDTDTDTGNKNTQHKNAGFSLVELTVASLILSVGSLAVLNLSLYWHSSLHHATTRMDEIDQLIDARPLPRIERRYDFLSCEQDP